MRRAQAREAARKAGRLTYLGQPCSRGHSGWRYVSCWNCVECLAEDAADAMARKRAQRRNTILATFYPDEFDAKGWHRLAVEAE